jgi:hypothetical protein
MTGEGGGGELDLGPDHRDEPVDTRVEGMQWGLTPILNGGRQCWTPIGSGGLQASQRAQTSSRRGIGTTAPKPLTVPAATFAAR